MSASATDALQATYVRLATSPDAAERELAEEQLSRLHRAQVPREAQEAAPSGPDTDLLTLIEQVLGPVRRRPSGTAVARCPWHGSKSGTCLVIWPAEGRWWCSSCRRGGDAVAWVALVEGLTPHQARKRLELPPAPAPAAKSRTGRRTPPAYAATLPDDWRPAAPTLPDDWRPGDPLPWAEPSS